MKNKKTIVPLKIMFAKFGLSQRLAWAQYSQKVFQYSMKPKPKPKPTPKIQGPKPSGGGKRKRRS